MFPIDSFLKAAIDTATSFNPYMYGAILSLVAMFVFFSLLAELEWRKNLAKDLLVQITAFGIGVFTGSFYCCLISWLWTPLPWWAFIAAMALVSGVFLYLTGNVFKVRR